MFVLVESGRTHNAFHKRVVGDNHYYIHLIPNFQIMIDNGGLMNYAGHCENVKLQLGEYHLKNHMLVFYMCGCDIVLADEWLCRLSIVTMNFREL